jgi:Uma2 family endonuclease
VAEILDGEFVLSPRPALPHAAAAAALSDELGPPFKRGRGGPGGWIILHEPELHLGADILVPDLGAWRRERLPAVPREPYLTLAPDWVCEVLSPSTEKLDRTVKLGIYARAEVRHAWLVNPDQRLLEVLQLTAEGWVRVAAHRDDERVRAVPFDAIELDLSVLWGGLAASLTYPNSSIAPRRSFAAMSVYRCVVAEVRLSGELLDDGGRGSTPEQLGDEEVPEAVEAPTGQLRAGLRSLEGMVEAAPTATSSLAIRFEQGSKGAAADRASDDEGVRREVHVAPPQAAVAPAVACTPVLLE